MKSNAASEAKRVARDRRRHWRSAARHHHSTVIGSARPTVCDECWDVRRPWRDAPAATAARAPLRLSHRRRIPTSAPHRRGHEGRIPTGMPRWVERSPGVGRGPAPGHRAGIATPLGDPSAPCSTQRRSSALGILDATGPDPTVRTSVMRDPGLSSPMLRWLPHGAPISETHARPATRPLSVPLRTARRGEPCPRVNAGAETPLEAVRRIPQP